MYDCQAFNEKLQLSGLGSSLLSAKGIVLELLPVCVPEEKLPCSKGGNRIASCLMHGLYNCK